MKEAKSRAQSKIGDRAPGELRVVAINCNPAPDAQDRLRRLFTILLEHAARRERQAASDDGDSLCGLPAQPTTACQGGSLMRPEPSLTVISLGGGVQSSVMTLMASRGAFDNIPDCAIFADTHWEPPSIYTHLEWLAGQLRFPLYVVDNGRSLREDVKALTNHSGSRNYVDIPVYLKGRDGER